jgi:flagellar assembly protein FliH
VKKDSEQAELKTLEDFWYQKGRQEGQEQGFQEGKQQGDSEGYRRGQEEGLAQGLEQGKQDGWASGYEAGVEESRGELKQQLCTLSAVLKDIKERQALLLEESKAEVLSFCLAVCEQLLRKELQDPAVLQTMIESLITQARPIIADASAQIFLNPADLAALDQYLPDWQESLTQADFLGDDGILNGDCRIETSMGLINFCIKRQLDALEKRVLEVEPSEPGHPSIEAEKTEDHPAQGD